MKIFDISLTLNNNTIVYPGNAPVSISSHSKLPEATSASSQISMGSHSGTHIDAPSHVFDGAKNIDDYELSQFVGPCAVFDCTHETESVTLSIIQQKFKTLPQKHKTDIRILLKTKNSIIGFEKFRTDYIFLSGDAAEYLAQQNVSLVGIDYISIKQKGSTDHRPHTALLEKNIAILEGVDLKDVSEGVYTLVCAPLKFVGIDGAPTRAILLQ